MNVSCAGRARNHKWKSQTICLDSDVMYHNWYAGVPKTLGWLFVGYLLNDAQSSVALLLPGADVSSPLQLGALRLLLTPN